MNLKSPIPFLLALVSGLGMRLWRTKGLIPGWIGNETGTDLTSEGPSTRFLFIVQPHPTVAVWIVTCVCVGMFEGVRVCMCEDVWVCMCEYVWMCMCGKGVSGYSMW